MKLVTYAQFLSDMERCFDKVIQEKESYIMPWEKENNIVILSMEEYNELKRAGYETKNKK